MSPFNHLNSNALGTILSTMNLKNIESLRRTSKITRNLVDASKQAAFAAAQEVYRRTPTSAIMTALINDINSIFSLWKDFVASIPQDAYHSNATQMHLDLKKNLMKTRVETLATKYGFIWKDKSPRMNTQGSYTGNVFKCQITKESYRIDHHVYLEILFPFKLPDDLSDWNRKTYSNDGLWYQALFHPPEKSKPTGLISWDIKFRKFYGSKLGHTFCQKFAELTGPAITFPYKEMSVIIFHVMVYTYEKFGSLTEYVQSARDIHSFKKAYLGWGGSEKNILLMITSSTLFPLVEVIEQLTGDVYQIKIMRFFPHKNVFISPKDRKKWRANHITEVP